MKPRSPGVLLAILSLLISLCATAQISGGYSRDGEAYTFNADGSFSWMQVTDNVIYGNGTYKINGKKIELSFEKGRLQIDIQLNKVIPSEQCTVEAMIMYSNGVPFTKASITLVQSGITEATTNAGLQMRLSDPLLDDKLVIDADGRKSAPIPVKLKGNKTLLGIVIDETSMYKENVNETLSFKMKRGRIVLNKKTFRKTS
ncbi:MAG: hypothetical protein WDO14_06915 [Bacteroidota bacterium]